MFTTSDYDAWPDSFEQSRINRLRRQAQGTQLKLDFAGLNATEDPAHCACQVSLRACERCFSRMEAETEAA